MEELTRKRVVLSVAICTILLLLLSSQCNSSFIQGSDVEPCYVNVIKSKIIFYNVTNETMKCCDTWCTGMCPFNVTITLNMTGYFTDRMCCPGYQGDDCIPHCSVPCGINKQCSEPELCTCIEGWSGDDCQQVANLTHTNVTSTSVQLSWLTPFNSNDNGYFSYCTTSNSLQYNTTVSTGQNTSIIDSLRPYTKYRCCVIPILLTGNGTETCQNVITPQTAPLTTPSNIKIRNTFNSSLLIKWSPPAVPNGIINYYSLYITYHSNNSQVVITINGQLIYYILNDLSLNESIQVTISATTLGGEGPHSIPVVHTLDSLVELSPFIYDIGSDDITYLNVLPSQLNSSLTTIQWTPPSSLHDTASFYVLTLTSLQQRLTTWTIGPRQTLNITLLIEPFIPHELNATIITKDDTIGIISNDVFFSREGVPKVSPIISSISRISPTKGFVKWTPLTLQNSRGLITNYTITLWRSSSNVSCGNIMEDSLIFVSADYSFIELKYLNIQLPYCVTIQGSTSTGPGLSSMSYLLPTYESNEFCLVFKGVYNCSTWILNDLNEKLRNLSITTVNILNSICGGSCTGGINVENIVRASNRISCLNDAVNNNDNMKYCSRLIGTNNISSIQLIDRLKEWNINNPTTSIILSGLSLSLTSVCNNENGNCTSIPIDSMTDYYKVSTLILSILLILVIVFQVLTCVVLVTYCNKYYSKKSSESIYSLPPHLSLYQSSLSSEKDSLRTGSESPSNDTVMSPPVSLITRSTNSTV